MRRADKLRNQRESYSNSIFREVRAALATAYRDGAHAAAARLVNQSVQDGLLIDQTADERKARLRLTYTDVVEQFND